MPIDTAYRCDEEKKTISLQAFLKKSLSQSNSALKTEPELFANIKKKKSPAIE